MAANAEKTEPSRSHNRAARWVVAAGLVLVAIGLAPSLLSKTGLRDRLLQALIGDSSLRVSSVAASFGWYSPLVIEGLRIRDPDGTVDITARRLEAKRSWLAMRLSAPEIGPISVEELRVELVLEKNGKDEHELDAEIASVPTFSVNLSDAALVIRESHDGDPALDAQHIDVTLRTEQRDGGSLLIVEPIVLAENVALTPEICDQGIQFVAPELVDEVGLEGSLSIELTMMQLAIGPGDAVRDSDDSVIAGVVTLHHTTAKLKNDITRRLVMAAVELMELGDVPESIRFAENAELKFRFAKNRVSHTGMVVLFPDDMPGLTLRSSGTVGMDESVDVSAELQVPLGLLNDTHLARRLAATPLGLRVSGTVDQLRMHTADDENWSSIIDDRLTQPDASQDEKELAGDVMKFLNELNRNPVAPRDENAP